MGAIGGPCNAGLVIIFFMPVLLLASALQLLSFNLWSKRTGTRNWFYPLISVAGVFIWGCLLSICSDDEDAIKDLFYLVPFLLFSIITLIVTILKTPEQQAGADTDR